MIRKGLPYLLASFLLHSARASSQPPPAQEPATPVMLRQLNLPRAEQLLMDRNLAVVASRHQLEVSEAMKLIAGYKPNPTVQIGAEQFPVWSPVAGSYPRFFSTNNDTGAEPTWTAQFTKLFERGGKRAYRVAQADAQVDAARYQILDTFRTQLFQLRQAFAAAMLARDNLKLARGLDQQYEQTEQLTLLRVKGGDLAGVELYRIKAGRLPYRQAILDAQNAYEQAARDILNLLDARPAVEGGLVPARGEGAPSAPAPLGFTYQPTIEVVGDFSDRPVRPGLAGLEELALAQRPDVKVARANLAAADEGVRLAEAQRSHDVTVAVEYQRVGNDQSVGMIAQVPLFLYNNYKTAIAQAEAQKLTAATQLRQAEMQARTDVAKAYQAYLAAKDATALYSSDNLVQVGKLREIAEFSYRQGNTSLFELLDAERTVRQTAVAFNQARASYQLAIWQLEAAIGQPLP